MFIFLLRKQLNGGVAGSLVFTAKKKKLTNDSRRTRSYLADMKCLYSLITLSLSTTHVWNFI